MAGQADSQPRPPELPVVGHAPHDREHSVHVADAPADHSVRPEVCVVNNVCENNFTEIIKTSMLPNSPKAYGFIVDSLIVDKPFTDKVILSIGRDTDRPIIDRL